MYNISGDYMNNSYLIRRGCAYLIDILIITYLVYGISQIKFLNPNIESYNLVYDNYTEKYNSTLNDPKVYQDSEFQDLTYQLAKNSVTATIADIVVIIGYFVLLQKYTGGQTVGKRLMSVKLVSKDDKSLKIDQLLLRASLLYYSLIPDILNLILLTIANEKLFFYSNLVITSLFSIVFYTSVLLVFFKKDNQGLHDMLSKTKVIDLKPVKEKSKS